MDKRGIKGDGKTVQSNYSDVSLSVSSSIKTPRRYRRILTFLQLLVAANLRGDGSAVPMCRGASVGLQKGRIKVSNAFLERLPLILIVLRPVTSRSRCHCAVLHVARSVHRYVFDPRNRSLLCSNLQWSRELLHGSHGVGEQRMLVHRRQLPKQTLLYRREISHRIQNRCIETVGYLTLFKLLAIRRAALPPGEERPGVGLGVEPLPCCEHRLIRNRKITEGSKYQAF